jgi:N-methylhydantoinase B
LQPVEVNENRYPWITEKFEMVTDSGGAGKYRGGLGTLRIMRVTAPEISCSGIGDRHKIRPPGRFRGKPGGAGGYFFKFKNSGRWVTAERLGFRSATEFTKIILTDGDIVMIRSSGGGGYGDPLDREPEDVLKDVIERNVSLRGAKQDYGVIIVGTNPKNFKVHLKKTQEQREKLRGKVGGRKVR